MSDFYVSTEAWRAEQWNGGYNGDVEHVREFLDQDGSRLGGFHRVRNTGQHIRKGQWIVRPTTGSYKDQKRRTRVLTDEEFRVAFAPVLPELRWIRSAPGQAEADNWHRLADKELMTVLCGIPLTRFHRNMERLYGEDPRASESRCEHCVKLI